MAENFNLIFGSQAPETASWSDADYQTGWNTVGSTPPTAEQFDFLQNRADKKAQELYNRLTPLEQKAQEQGRQAGTAYTAGASATVDGLPADWLLVCTTAGISGTSEVVLPDPLVDGATITDGTITWTLRKLATNGALGYRQPSTSYALGVVAHNAGLPTGTYLECTTAGQTGSGALTITSPTVGRTVSDGTVTWTIRKNASTQDLTGYLPLSGGQLSGYIYGDSGKALYFKAAPQADDGPSLALYGLDIQDSQPIIGGFEIIAMGKDKTTTKSLLGYNNGNLTWCGNSLDKSAVVAESLGANGYRKYASGLIEQWGFASPTGQTPSENGIPINFNISFTNTNYIVTTCNNDRFFILVSVDAYTPDKFKYWAYDHNGNLVDDGFFWRAIGY